MTNAWREYKKKLGTTRPWDVLKANTEYASEDTVMHRLAICEACPQLIQLTHQCKECGCFMKIKTKLQLATCPLDKW